ncbi:MAG: serine/threonine-protein kinase [Myxococcota bacterium]|nr:serine/threonine-protein kinase [Myxococcota bacterium]
MNSCLTQAELTALSRGELSPEEAAGAQAHVDTCPLCYAQLLRGDRPDTGGEETGVIQGGARWAEPSPSELNWQPGLDLGRYVILLTLGRGGMGVVFRAYDKELDRAVALKVLHQSEDEGGTPAASRLLREAQAMARLSHPNVVGVHDVVVLQRRVCVVMELVEGVNVREWLRSEPRRPWKEVVEVFRAAGEGLAAAHDAKLVHRDFKPDNVLVGQDGRARVTDFGIARLASTDPEKVLTPGALKTPAGAGTETFHTLSGGTVGGSTLGDTITREGQVVGTPRYMAPEQFEKLPADFRTDQFSFGVALYEALYGQHAFEGKKASEWLEHARRGEVRPPPPSSPVPMWIHRILVRTLSADPAGRFQSMRELNLALGRDPSQRRNRLLAGAGVAAAVVLALVAVGQSLRARAQLCSGAGDKLAGVWDPLRREQLRAAFTATGLPFAEDSSSRAQQVLDDYSSRWATTHQEACLATRVRGEQSDQVLTLRMGCLQQRLDAVAAMTDLFARADASTVGKAKQLLDGLPRLETCSDVSRLTARLPPPEDPQAAAEVERIRKELTRSMVLSEAGRVKEAGEIARPALAAAQQLDHPPLIAEAETNMAVVLSNENRPQEALELFTTAFAHALAQGHDEVLTTAAVRLAAMNVRTRQEKRSLEWATFAESANQRARDPETAAMVHNARGNVARNGGGLRGRGGPLGKGPRRGPRQPGPGAHGHPGDQLQPRLGPAEPGAV